MAFLARNGSVLTFEHIPGLLVVKLLLGRLPVNQVEILAIVLQVTPHAVLPVRILHPQPGMVAMFGCKVLGYLFVAIQALKGGSAGSELVTTCALRCTG